MHRSLIRHGLRQSFCTVAAPRGGRLHSTSIQTSHTTRQSNGGTSDAKQKRRPVKTEDLSSQDLTFPANVNFQGFPHLEPAKEQQLEEVHDGNDSRDPTASQASKADLCHGMEEPRGKPKAHRDLADGLDRGENCASWSEDSSAEGRGHQTASLPDQSHGPLSRSKTPRVNIQRAYDGHEKPTVIERPYMRRLRKPKRFRELLSEARRYGADSTRSMDLNSGRPKKTLIRSALTTAVLEAELRWIAKNTPHARAVRNILKILIQDRKIRPAPDHYEALILGQCFPEYGSVDNVKLILQEMEREGIPLEVPILLAVLTVLAVHPDTNLRTSIVARLAKQQIPIHDTHAHLNTLCLIREGQLELATVELEKLTQKTSFIGGMNSMPVPKWLWTIYIHAICDVRHDFDALLQLLYRLSDSGFLFPRPTLLHLLFKASEHGDPHVTKFIWYGYVTGMHIIPNEDMCMSVLRLAVREKDVKLAESVAVVLESVAGNKTTCPPSLEDQGPSSRQEASRLTFDSPELLGHESGAGHQQEHSHSVGNDSDSNIKASKNTVWPSAGPSQSTPPTSSLYHADLATIFSTPPTLPNPSDPPPPPRPLPAEALSLLAELGITGFEATDFDTGRKPLSLRNGKLVEYGGRPGRRRRRTLRGILYPLFREEAGLSGARFDPRLALLQGWDWRKR
ncbi:uncharacterized protein Z519_06144 [Cladophialophora bantiana CBS 173.52]|uniref:Pentacotripeptide-repeat region of PRORP domain-containing protein n=1 Tax=Cladophialophora bantiana (strain ATCC 10958 / CBS 173.52 / CDC B-1940 / NIH 8579) TaxID=1442370 RepID=A0A0D2I9T7_CLAB1|nr:uncharacterized protein Z519_06144 [Cladophialophora bantiana CBS 173.52]KIW93539.1 hypothetical protein Z519_06144 [Cladophialophora bantiana CBS 173.52]